MATDVISRWYPFRKLYNLEFIVISLSKASEFPREYPVRSMVFRITVTSWWARWRLKSPAFRLYTQPFVQAQIKENIKAPRHWRLWEEFTGDRRIPHTNGQ